MKLVKILFIVITGLVITNVTLTNRNVDESVVVADLGREIAALQNQNTIMRAEVASLGSLTTLSPKLAEAGYIASPKVVSLPLSSSVALR